MDQTMDPRIKKNKNEKKERKKEKKKDKKGRNKKEEGRTMKNKNKMNIICMFQSGYIPHQEQ